MDEKKNIAFVRVDILDNWRFWNQFAKLNDFEGAGKKVIEISTALLEEDYTNEIAAKLLHESKEFQQKKMEAGRKGGLAKARNAKTQQTNQPTNQESQATIQPTKRKRPPTKEEVYEFAQDHNLDEVDSRDWYERNFIERPGCDEHGEVIRNWQGALINSCKAAKRKREQQQ